VNWRAIGCGTFAAAVFVALGILSILRVSAPAECPGRLPYEPAAYEPVGEPASEPTLAGVDESLDHVGKASFGLASWDVYVQPGFAPTASGEPLPQRIVLDCGDGTFQAFHRDVE
jgi:hypothetical protein